jgi:tetratricopeptide (TPR) repeat protein
LGLMDEAIAVQEQAIRLSPRDPYIANWYYRIGQAHLLQGRVDEAARWFERACAGNPTMPFLYAYLASAYGLRGESERAAEALAEARRLSDDDLYSSVASLREHVSSIYFVVPSVRAMFEQTYFAGLRKAGMPG